jgi:hypothetical protein
MLSFKIGSFKLVTQPLVVALGEIFHCIWKATHLLIKVDCFVLFVMMRSPDQQWLLLCTCYIGKSSMSRCFDGDGFILCRPVTWELLKSFFDENSTK